MKLLAPKSHCFGCLQPKSNQYSEAPNQTLPNKVGLVMWVEFKPYCTFRPDAKFKKQSDPSQIMRSHTSIPIQSEKNERRQKEITKVGKLPFFMRFMAFGKFTNNG